MSALVGNALGEKSDDTTTIACQGITFGIIVSVLGIIVGYLTYPYLISIVSEPGSYRDAANRKSGAQPFVHIRLGTVPGSGLQRHRPVHSGLPIGRYDLHSHPRIPIRRHGWRAKLHP